MGLIVDININYLLIVKISVYLVRYYSGRLCVSAPRQWGRRRVRSIPCIHYINYSYCSGSLFVEL